MFFAPDTPTQVLCALLVTIVALAVSNNVRPFMRTCDDVGNVVMQYQVRSRSSPCAPTPLRSSPCAPTPLCCSQILLTLLGGLVLSSGVSEADGYNVRAACAADAAVWLLG